ncbi:MAG: hypothetical protein R3314_13515 [Longimicrobiales bacterium]|nr:hypothetical protein [Longimicrobiales bacterium]
MAPEPSSSDSSLFTELRRRGVLGVAVVYGVVGWTVVEVADAVFPALDLPDWTVTLVVALVLLGFPLALVLAWALERTPQGVQRAAPAGGRRVAAAFVLGIALVAVLAFLVVDAPSASEARSYTAIAVLPFEDLSPDDRSYFSEGIAEELMDVLATVPELDVAGRASAFAFRDRTAGVTEIGARLGVDAVLDGSVRRDGDDLRISVQLIDVADGRVLWSHRYDRQAGDIFALQDEIASAVAGEVDIRLSLPPPAEADAARLRAHDLYLRGLAAWHRRTSRGMEEASRLFHRAIAADSTYAAAHGGVALTHALFPMFVDDPGRDHAEIALRAADRALALDPGAAEAHAALSQRAVVLTWDRETGVAEARKAIELRPSYATGWQWYGEALMVQYRLDESLAALERAIELDPLAAAPRNVRAGVLYASGRRDAALTEIREARDRFPDVPLFHDNLLGIGLCEVDTTLILEGAAGLRVPELDAALPALLDPVRAPPGSPRREALERLVATAPSHFRSRLALLMAGLGEYDLALRTLHAVVSDGDDPGFLYTLVMPCYDPIREDPRFRAVLDRLPS